jgi:hypothetical protein
MRQRINQSIIYHLTSERPRAKMKTHENEDPIDVILPAFDHLVFLFKYIEKML